MTSTSESIALVTGSSRGIGGAIAQTLAEQGHRVILHGRTDSPALQQQAEQLRALDRLAGVLTYDVSDSAAIATACKSIFSQHKRLDVLVNNAGLFQSSLLPMLKTEDFEQLWRVNVQSVLVHSQYAARLMQRSGGGSIVNLSSIIGVEGLAGEAGYSATKAAVVGLTRSLSKELGPASIRVNCVAPGFIETDLTAHFPEATRTRFVQQTSLRRLGTARDVAEVVTFLVSPAAGFVTGQVLGVDGGLVI